MTPRKGRWTWLYDVKSVISASRPPRRRAIQPWMSNPKTLPTPSRSRSSNGTPVLGDSVTEPVDKRRRGALGTASAPRRHPHALQPEGFPSGLQTAMSTGTGARLPAGTELATQSRGAKLLIDGAQTARNYESGESNCTRASQRSGVNAVNAHVRSQNYPTQDTHLKPRPSSTQERSRRHPLMAINT